MHINQNYVLKYKKLKNVNKKHEHEQNKVLYKYKNKKYIILVTKNYYNNWFSVICKIVK